MSGNLTTQKTRTLFWLIGFLGVMVMLFAVYSVKTPFVLADTAYCSNDGWCELDICKYDTFACSCEEENEIAVCYDVGGASVVGCGGPLTVCLAGDECGCVYTTPTCAVGESCSVLLGPSCNWEGDWGPCGGFDNVCDESGTMSQPYNSCSCVCGDFSCSYTTCVEITNYRSKECWRDTDGDACFDANPCTGGDACSGGTCTGTVSGSHGECKWAMPGGWYCDLVRNTSSSCTDECETDADCGEGGPPLSTPTPTPTPSPGLNVTLSVSTTSSNWQSSLSGTAPLNGVDLRAIVGGTATGTINYTWYCNRADTGTNITSPWSAKDDGAVSTSLIKDNICNYSSTGTYYAKVIVERGSLAAQAQVIITATTSAPSCVPPAFMSPTGNITRPADNKVTLSWAQVPGADWYDVRLDYPPVDGVPKPNNIDPIPAPNCASPLSSNPHYVCENSVAPATYCSGGTCSIPNIPVPISNGPDYWFWLHPRVNTGTWDCTGATSFTLVAPNSPPSVPSVTVTEPDYCTGPGAYINWTYSDPDGDPQSAYQVQIDDTGSAWNPPYIFDCLCQNGTFSGSACPLSGACDGSLKSIFATGLNFNITHKARVRVWDTP